MQKIALLGGTFDPIHIGHLRTAVQLLNAGFDQVRLIPNAVPPHRAQPQASGEQRINMLRLAVDGIAGLVVDDIELKRSEISYSADTVKLIRDSFSPQECITWVMGLDAWLSFDRWHKPEQVLQQVNLLLVDRPAQQPSDEPSWQQTQRQLRQCQLPKLLETAFGAIAKVQWPLLEVSATDIRQQLSQGLRVDFLLDDAVLSYIKQQDLY